MLDLIGSIPSPENGKLGPVHLYGILIAIGVVVATTVGDRRWRKRGGDKETIGDIAFLLVIFGAIGARLYHVATDYETYIPNNPMKILYVWNGGLSIWGAVLGGAAALVVIARKRKLPTLMIADCLGPAILLAQAIGRWGNYANQELFGKPLNASWALEISPKHRPVGYIQYATFHPTFLYESLWCIAMFAIIISLERRMNWKIGQSVFAYVALYTVGRFGFENLRIDNARKIGPMRINAWISLGFFVLGVAGFLYYGRKGREWPVQADGTPGPIAIEKTTTERPGE
ncbi:MAG: prolipoprotein diacylglyceryl transferase [Acidimicrobiia bacterium]